MKENFESDFSRKLSAICFIVAPLLLLTGSLFGLFAPQMSYWHYLFCKAGFATFVFALFALIQIMRPAGERFALIVGGMAIIGAVSGTTLYSFQYFFEQMNVAGFDAASLESLKKLFFEVYRTMVLAPLPGLFFPIGLLILSIGLFRKKLVSRPAAIILAIAAFSFPFGRIPGIAIIRVVTDVLFLISMSYIGWQIWGESKQPQHSPNKAYGNEAVTLN